MPTLRSGVPSLGTVLVGLLRDAGKRFNQHGLGRPAPLNSSRIRTIARTDTRRSRECSASIWTRIGLRRPAVLDCLPACLPVGRTWRASAQMAALVACERAAAGVYVMRTVAVLGEKVGAAVDLSSDRRNRDQLCGPCLQLALSRRRDLLWGGGSRVSGVGRRGLTRSQQGLSDLSVPAGPLLRDVRENNSRWSRTCPHLPPLSVCLSGSAPWTM